MDEFAGIKELLLSSDSGDRKRGISLLFGDGSDPPLIEELIENLDEDPAFSDEFSQIIFSVPRKTLYTGLAGPLKKADSRSFGRVLSALADEDDYDQSSFLCGLFYELDSGSKKKAILDHVAAMDTLPPDGGREIIDYYLERNDFLDSITLLLRHPSINVREKGLSLLASTASPKAGRVFAQAFADDESSELKSRWIKLLKRFSDDTALEIVAAVAGQFSREHLDDLNIFLRETAGRSPDQYLYFLDKVRAGKEFFSGVSSALKGIVDLDYLPQIVNSTLEMDSLEARKAYFSAVESIISYHLDKSRMTDNEMSRGVCRRELARLLSSKDRHVRHGTLELLLKFGGDCALEAMTFYMKAEEGDREYLESCFARTPPSVMIPRLLSIRNADNRQLTALLKIIRSTQDTGYIPYVIRIISGDDPGVRAYGIKCAESMGYTPDYAIYCRDDDADIRYWSCYLLRGFPSPESVKLLAERMVDPNVRVRGIAVESLGFCSEFDKVLGLLEEAFDDPEEGVRESAVDALGMIGSREAHAIMQKNLGRVTNQRLKEKMVNYITAKRKRMLLDNFGQIPLEHRDTVAKSIYKLDHKLVEDLREKMSDLDPAVRFRAVEILCSITDRGDLSIIPLLQKAASDPDKKIRALITEALGKSGDKTSYRTLLKLLNDPNDRVRANVIESLEKYGKKEEVIALLVPFLEDRNNRVRANTIIALWRLGYQNIWNSLKSLLDSEDGLFVASGLFVLRQIEFKGPYEFLEKFFGRESNILKYNLLLTMEELGLVNMFRPRIRKMLKDEDTRISQKALELLEE